MEKVTSSIAYIKSHQFLILGVLLAISLAIFGVLTGTHLGLTVEGGHGVGSAVVQALQAPFMRAVFGAIIGSVGIGFILSAFKYKKLRVLFSGLMTLSFLYIVILRVLVLGLTSFTGFFVVLVVVSFLVYINMTEAEIGSA